MPDLNINVRFPNSRVEFRIILDSDNFNEAFLIRHFNYGVCYESEVALTMLRVVKEGDYCIDIGANIGFFTLLLAKLVGATGHVLAFEPGTDNLAKLKKNIELNAIGNVTLIEQPAWSRREKLRFHLCADSTGSHALWDPGKFFANEETRRNPQSYEVEAVPLDDYVTRAPKLIKIDTEGAEQRILEGAEITLRRYHPPFIIAEFNPSGSRELGCSGASLRDLMYGFGYDTFLIHGDGALPSLIPRTTEITYENDIVVMNAMFSTLEAVSEYWPKVPYA